MNVSDEAHIIRSRFAAGWEKHQCHLPESEEHLLIYQGRQLYNDKQAPLSPGKFQVLLKLSVTKNQNQPDFVKTEFLLGGSTLYRLNFKSATNFKFFQVSYTE